MRKLLILFLLVFTQTVGYNQGDLSCLTSPEAKRIIDKVCKQYESFSSLQVTFILTSIHNGYKSTDTILGMVEGDRYRISMPSQEIACNGSKVMFFDKRKKTLSEATPNPNEVNLVFPHKMLRLYEKEYNCNLVAETKLADRIIQKLEFLPKNTTKDINKIQIYVDKASHQILRVTRFSKSGTNFSLDFRNVLYNIKIHPRNFTINMS